MNRPVAEPPAADTDTPEVAAGNRYRRRARFEAIFASIWLAIGLFALPAAIFAVGGALLGPYGETGRLDRFYGDFFGDLAEPVVHIIDGSAELEQTLHGPFPAGMVPAVRDRAVAQLLVGPAAGRAETDELS